MVENAKFEKFKWDISGDFQTLWMRKEARAPHLTRVNNH